ncbi:MAG: hypothetical protein MI743_05440 [Sneathiellales bacterium]|nr:hypothetical protein [Sneathiellales bacterium]
MGTLELPQIAENQLAAYITSNDADAALEKAICDCELGHDATAGDFGITETAFRENWFHRIAGSAGAGFVVTVPALKRPFVIMNSSGQSATVSTGSGASIVVEEGTVRLLYCDGSNIIALTDETSTGAAASGFSGAMVSLGANQSVADSSDTALEWTVSNHDSDDFHDTGTNPSRFTIPVGISTVILTAQIRWDSDDSDIREVKFWKNGNSSYQGRAFLRRAATNNLLLNLVSPPLAVTAGDYFEVAVWQNSGESRDVLQHYSCWFSLQAFS